MESLLPAVAQASAALHRSVRATTSSRFFPSAVFPALLLMVLASAAAAARYPDPVSGPFTPKVYLSGAPTLDGVALAAGDEVVAYSVHNLPGVPAKWERTLIGHAVIGGDGRLNGVPVFGDDNTTPGVVEGAAPGEEICLVLWRAAEGREYAAYTDGAGHAGRVTWTGDGATVPVDVDFTDGQRIPLRNGAWNLTSYSVLKGWHRGAAPPSKPQLTDVTWEAVATIGDSFPLTSIAGRYDRILANDGAGATFWNPSLPGISTLSYLAPGYGYWVKTKSSSHPLSWMTVPGRRTTGAETLALSPGWVLTGFWGNEVYHVSSDAEPLQHLFPVDVSDNVLVASMGEVWSSVGTSYVRISAFDDSGAKLWNPSLPQISTLRYIGPGYGYWVKLAAADDLALPSSPFPLNVTAAAADGLVHVAWDPVPGANSYALYWSASPGVTKTPANRIPVAVEAYTHGGLANGTTYHYAVSAVTDGIESVLSTEVSATPFVPPPGISGFAPSAGPPGTVVTILGANFRADASANSVGIGGASAVVVAATASRLDVIVSDGAASGAISVATAGGTATSAGIFTVTRPSPSVRAAITGSVSYSGSRSGRIYVRARRVGAPDAGHGTSIAGPGPYVIRGVPPGEYRLTAYLDIVGNGRRTSMSPSAESAAFTVWSDDVPVGELSLLDASPPAAAPVVGNISPKLSCADNAALVTWQAPLDARGVEIARKYYIQSGSSFPVVLLRDIPARGGIGRAIVKGPTAGLEYVAVGMVLDDQESPAPYAGPNGCAFGGLVAGATVAGTAVISGVNPTGPLYLILTSSQDPLIGYVGSVSTPPAGPVPYYIRHVQDGDYVLDAFIDMNDNGYPDAGDISLAGGAKPIVTVRNGIPAAGVDIALSPRNADARAVSIHEKFRGAETYKIGARVLGAVKAPVAATVEGPGVSAADIGASEDKAGALELEIEVPRPYAGDTYTLRVHYGDGSSDTFSSSVTGVVDAFPTPVSPVGDYRSATFDIQPLFGWSPPDPVPSPAEYQVYVWSDDGSPVWHSGGLVAFRFPASQSFPNWGITLGRHKEYVWAAALADTDGNEARSLERFVTHGPPPQVTFFTPSSGPPGTAVSISGTNFIGGENVIRFNGVQAAIMADGDGVSAPVRAEVPAGATSGPISVTTSEGTGASASAFTVTAPPPPPPPPTITGVVDYYGSPVTSAPSGSLVIIRGANFDPAPGKTGVKFNGVPARISDSYSKTTELWVSPPDAAGTGRITVTTAGGTATSGSDFTVLCTVQVSPATVTLDPGQAASFSARVTSPTDNSVAWSVTESGGGSVVSTGADTASYTAPATPGTYHVVATSVADPARSASAVVTGLPPPAITGFAPSSGPPGTPVALTGEFRNLLSADFNGIPATINGGSATTLYVQVPAGATTGPITVRANRGNAVSGSDFTVTTLPSPVITSFSPDNAIAGSTVYLMIAGQNFSPLPDGNEVRVNGIPARVTSAGATMISAIVPASCTTGRVTVTTSAGTAVSDRDFTVLPVPSPVITGISPENGPVGTAVTVSGTNLASPTGLMQVVRFNGVPAKILSAYVGSVQVSVPAGATTGPVTVTTEAGTGASPANFTVTAASLPSIQSVSPTSGGAGTPVSIAGRYFAPTAVPPVVRFNGARAGVLDWSDTTVVTVVPAGASTGRITVTTDVGTGSSPADFAVSPQIGIVPSSVRTGPGGTVDLAASAAGAADPSVTWMIQETDGGTFSRIAATAATYIAPSVPGTYHIVAASIAYPAVCATATVTVLPAPTIIDVTPLSGGPGTTVTATGTGFSPLGNPPAMFIAGIAVPASRWTDTMAQFAVPAGAVSGPVSVATDWGSAVSGVTFTVTGSPAPPVPPSALVALPGETSNVLTWADSPGASSYNVYWSTSPGVTKATGTRIPGSQSPYTHAGLATWTTYYYVVTASNAAGESTESPEASAQPRILPPPAPMPVTAAFGSRSNTISWGPAARAVSYDLYWGTSPGVTTASGNRIPGVASPYTHSGLTDGTTYRYVVVARNAGGDSPPSTEVSATPLSPPASVSIAAGPSSNYLSWSPAPGAVSYNMYWATSPGVARAAGSRIGGIGSTSFLHSGLADGVTYYYVLTSQGSGGESAPSAEVSATPRSYAISGRITAAGAALASVTVTLTGTVQRSATTDASGNYAFAGLPAGSYVVTPSMWGYTFSPGNLPVVISAGNAVAQDFTASQTGGGSGWQQYYPLVSGNRWTYRTTVTGQYPSTSTSTETASTSGGNPALIYSSGDGSHSDSHMVIQGTGLFEMDQHAYDRSGVLVSTTSYSPYLLTLPTSFAPGHSESVSSTVTSVSGGNTSTMQYTAGYLVEAVESVTVPAGSFANAVRVKYDYTYRYSDGATSSNSYNAWFVQGIGCVKTVQVFSLGTSMTELMSYSLQ